MSIPVVTPSNLSNDFDLGGIVSGKVSVKSSTPTQRGVVVASSSIIPGGQVGKFPDSKQVADYIAQELLTYGATSDKRVVGWEAYNPATNILGLRMKDNTVYDIDLSALIDDTLVSGVNEPITDAFGINLGFIRPL